MQYGNQPKWRMQEDGKNTSSCFCYNRDGGQEKRGTELNRKEGVRKKQRHSVSGCEQQSGILVPIKFNVFLF